MYKIYKNSCADLAMNSPFVRNDLLAMDDLPAMDDLLANNKLLAANNLVFYMTSELSFYFQNLSSVKVSLITCIKIDDQEH